MIKRKKTWAVHQDDIFNDGGRVIVGTLEVPTPENPEFSKTFVSQFRLTPPQLKELSETPAQLADYVQYLDQELDSMEARSSELDSGI